MKKIGVDESGKGDYFGYLVIAGVYTDEKTEKLLRGLRVRDSKSVQDPSCLKLAARIKKLCEHDVVKISPEKYNKLYEKFGNLNSMLAWGHAKVIDNMVKKTKCMDVISDKFSEENLIGKFLKQMESKNPRLAGIRLVRKTGAESDIAVAAASILARAEFLKTLRTLSRTIGYSLPKGAAHVGDAANEIVKLHGMEVLDYVAKLHFKTTKNVKKSA